MGRILMLPRTEQTQITLSSVINHQEVPKPLRDTVPSDVRSASAACSHLACEENLLYEISEVSSDEERSCFNKSVVLSDVSG